jgi:hypothetical protein
MAATPKRWLEQCDRQENGSHRFGEPPLFPAEIPGRQTSAEWTVGPSPNQIATALPTTNRMMKMTT